jgi:hypothetical protein
MADRFGWMVVSVGHSGRSGSDSIVELLGRGHVCGARLDRSLF